MYAILNKCSISAPRVGGVVTYYAHMLVDVKCIGLLCKIVVSNNPPCPGFLVIFVPDRKSGSLAVF
jgi:hypothetical protein